VPDICDLILDEHEIFRRRFAELDEHRRDGADGPALATLWGPLADLLERHAALEEVLFYPRLLNRGDPDAAGEETKDAIRDHNDIRDDVARAKEEPPGSAGWWEAVDAARRDNSDHMAEEERTALADFRIHGSKDLREELGARWVAETAEHPRAEGLPTEDKDADRYVARHRDG
jgi:hypothetical protein